MRIPNTSLMFPDRYSCFNITCGRIFWLTEVYDVIDGFLGNKTIYVPKHINLFEVSGYRRNGSYETQVYFRVDKKFIEKDTFLEYIRLGYIMCTCNTFSLTITGKNATMYTRPRSGWFLI